MADAPGATPAPATPATPAAPAATADAAATPSAPGNQAPTDAPLGEAGQKALDAFKERARAAEAKVKELSPLADKARELEAANQTETEKLTGKVSALTDDNKGLQATNLRLRVALDKKLDPALIDRLKGSTKEELESDADELMKLVGEGGQTPAPAPSFDGGARAVVPDQKTPEQAHNDLLVGLFGKAQQQQQST